MTFLMEFIEHNIENSVKLVDLCELAKNLKKRLRIVIDADTCLDRLYGGYNSNWLPGCDWIRVYGFYKNLARACFRNNIELIIYFNGTNPEDLEINEWESREKSKIIKINKVFDCLNHQEVPKKRFWIKPINLIRQIIIQLKTDKMNIECNLIKTFMTLRNHQKEIIEFCELNSCEYLFTNDSEIVAFILAKQLKNIKLFSARSFTLSYKGNITAKQFNIDGIFNMFNIHPKHFPLFCILLGNRYVSDKIFSKFYERIHSNYASLLKEYADYDYRSRTIIAIINYLSTQSLKDESKCVRRLLENIFEGFKDARERADSIEKIINDIYNPYDNNYNYQDFCLKYNWIVNLDNDLNNNFKLMKTSGSTYEMLICDDDDDDDDNNHKNHHDRSAYSTPTNNNRSLSENQHKQQYNNFSKPKYITDHKCDQPYHHSCVETQINNLKQLHVRGNVSPWMYLVYVKRKIYLTASLECNSDKYIKSNKLYRPIRTMAYSILLYANLKFNRKDHFVIDEIEYNYIKAENESTKVMIESIEPLDLKYLNFNLDKIWCENCSNLDNKISLFIDCVKISDDQNETIRKYDDYYKKKYFIPCAILRYILKFGKILTSNDIKAFVCTFLSDRLKVENDKEAEKIQLINPRALHLISLFMSGVENFSFVNDVCGLPFPYDYFNMCNYFNGFLFQQNFQNISSKSLLQLCDNQIAKSILAEKLIFLIIENLDEFVVVPKLIIEPPIKTEDLSERLYFERKNLTSYTISRGGRGKIFEGASIKNIIPPIEFPLEISSSMLNENNKKYLNSPNTTRRQRNAIISNLEQDNNNNNNNNKSLKKDNYEALSCLDQDIDKKLESMIINDETQTTINNQNENKKKYSDEDLYILSLFNIYPDTHEEKMRKYREKLEERCPWLKGGKEPIRNPKFKPYTWDDLIRTYKSVPHPPREIVTVNNLRTKKQIQEQIEILIQEAKEKKLNEESKLKKQ